MLIPLAADWRGLSKGSAAVRNGIVGCRQVSLMSSFKLFKFLCAFVIVSGDFLGESESTQKKLCR